MKFSKLNFPHIHLESVDSTNNYALNLLAKTSPEDGFCVYADFQTEGRGQYGRNWQSEAGSNLLVSFIYNSQELLRANDLFILHQICSLAVLNVLKRKLPYSEICIKWPNDIYVEDRKIAGILIQNIIRGQQINWSVIGVGLNVNQTQFDNTIDATSLALVANIKFDRIELLQSLHDEMLGSFTTAELHTGMKYLQEYNAYLYQRNQEIHLEKRDGGRITGILCSVDESGKLWIESEGKRMGFDWSTATIKKDC